jgi:competence protein ComEC
MAETGTGVGRMAGARATQPGRALVTPAQALASLIRVLEAEQRRWFLWVPVCFGLGITLYFVLSSEPPLLLALMPAPAAIVLAIVWREGALSPIATGALMAAALGFGVAKLRTELVRAPVLERQYNLVDVRGWVELAEPRPGRGQRLTLRVIELANLPADKRPYRVRVRTSGRVPGLAPGVALRLRATLAPPAIPALPGDYDFSRAAWFARIGGVGYALARPAIDPDAPVPPVSLQFWAAIERVRQGIGQRIVAALPGEAGAIANALVTGERGGISAATNDAYRSSGLFHILSISGLHMVIMAGAAYAFVRALLALIPSIALRHPIKKWAAVAAALAALGYLLISGYAPPTVRSYVMISIMHLAILLDRPAIALRNVALSALAILAVSPETLFDIGFQMSYAAVVALISAYEALRERRRADEDRRERGVVLRALGVLGAIMLTTVIATAAVAPFAAYYFHNSQQYAMLANLLAIPICNLVVMPAALATLLLMPLGLEGLALWVMGHGIDAMTWVAYRVASLSGATLRIPAIPTLAFALAVLGGLWLALWRTRWRLLGLVAIAAGVGLAPTLRRPDILVGRDGQLVAIRLPDRSLSAIGARGTAFELQRWLDHDGDYRTAREASDGKGFACDALGCTAEVKGLTLAVSRHPAALADDCRRARVLVMTFPRLRGCDGASPVLDFFDLRRDGTHAVYIDGTQARVVTVAAVRGERPWSEPRGPRTIAPLAGRPLAAGTRLGAFAPPFELSEPGGRPRPEIEDEDVPLPDDDRGG